MVSVRQILGGCLCLILLTVGSVEGAVTPEARLLNAARESFRGRLYERAEAEFGEFVKKFPGSPEVPEAILLQAQARLQRTNYDGAIALLSANGGKAGALADQYIFWRAEAHSRKGEHAQAAAVFAELVSNFSNSSRRLEAALREAESRAHLGEWAKVEGLLESTNGVFQTFLQSSPTNDFAGRGYLLLGEARLAQRHYEDAEAALKMMAQLSVSPADEWRRQNLICRIRMGQGRSVEAFQVTTNLLTIATNINSSRLLADTISLRAGILVTLKRTDEAAAEWQQNLTPGAPAEHQREAILKVAELAVAGNKPGPAAQMLENYVVQFPRAAAADLAWMTAGELRLKQHLASPSDQVQSALVPQGSPTNTAGVTALQAATAAFKGFLEKFPENPQVGKGWLNLGWCYSLQGNLAESRSALRQAVAKLPPSLDHATALFKLGDAEYQLKAYSTAVSNYTALVEQYASTPAVRTNFLETALYQGMRAAWAAGNVPVATNTLEQLLAWFPTGPETDRAVLLAGQEFGKRDDVTRARGVLTAFVQQAPNAALVPEIQLAIARTYEQETNWSEAITHYDKWLSIHTNHEAVPSAEYFRASAHFQAGHETNALNLLTNFVEVYRTNEFTPLARLWVADYYFRQGGPLLVEAEKNYQLLAQNWPNSELSYQARMMAGRVALARLGWDDARSYFTRLWNDTNCPTHLRVQALYAYGDTLMTMDAGSTNRMANYEEAIRVFTKIIDLYPTNEVAVLAWGQKANCLLQYIQAAPQNESLSNACYSFEVVINSPLAAATARSIAKVGLALAIEKDAGLRKPEDQASALRTARDHLLDVLFEKNLRENETPDPFWVRKAGIEAGRICESLQEWESAIHVYEKLIEMLPPLKARFEKNIARAREQLNRRG